MTLYTNDYLEYYLTLVGWIIGNGIWDVLVASGIVALPFVVMVVQEWLKARSEGADEGNKGLLSTLRIEGRVYVAMAVVYFACIPAIPIDLSNLAYDTSRSTQCQVHVATPQQTRWSKSFTTLNNQSAQVPIWWFLVHAASKAVTGAAVAAIPCGTDLRQMRMDIDATRIRDPLLAQEVADFSHACYGPARARLFMQRPNLNEADLDDVNWIGSKFFLTAPGYYDYYHAKRPMKAWDYEPKRDAGLAQIDGAGGYPTCSQWWNDAGRGLRGRLIEQVDPGLLANLGKWAGFLSQAQANDAMIRTLASPRQQALNQGAVYTDYGGQVTMTAPNVATRATADLGLTVGSLAFFPAMDTVRQALPMVLSFLKMALVICIPLVMLFGTYDLQSLMTVTCVQFALFFVDFWFQLARWIDSTILDALYGWDSPHSNFNLLMGLNNSFGDMLLNFVMATMFIILPGFWVSALTWVGVRMGGAVQGLSDGSKAASQAGSKGVDVVKRMK
ncbi:conjugal transfer protein TraG N-terminal domain-containing protein [Pseudomonas fluorescens]|uniref:conjugal transfer protein TraG N-terminal domain-containing protein n=1 Tax=Pseudomonas fluorescens TaxID=294 RepID=UPI001BE52668|nr:conjugal transfer protein TraG N-terminal domain-containing protein [Pseudomonas fluorescens]